MNMMTTHTHPRKRCRFRDVFPEPTLLSSSFWRKPEHADLVASAALELEPYDRLKYTTLASSFGRKKKKSRLRIAGLGRSVVSVLTMSARRALGYKCQIGSPTSNDVNTCSRGEKHGGFSDLCLPSSSTAEDLMAERARHVRTDSSSLDNQLRQTQGARRLISDPSLPPSSDFCNNIEADSSTTPFTCVRTLNCGRHEPSEGVFEAILRQSVRAATNETRCNEGWEVHAPFIGLVYNIQLLDHPNMNMGYL